MTDPTHAQIIAYLARHGGIQPSEVRGMDREEQLELYHAMVELVATEQADADAALAGIGVSPPQAAPQPTEPPTEPTPESTAAENPDATWFFSDPKRVERCAGRFVAVSDCEVLEIGSRIAAIAALGNAGGTLIDLTGENGAA